MMSEKTSMTKLSGPNRSIDTLSDSGALPQCPEMSTNVRDSEIPGLTLRCAVTIWSNR